DSGACCTPTPHPSPSLHSPATTDIYPLSLHDALPIFDPAPRYGCWPPRPLCGEGEILLSYTSRKKGEKEIADQKFFLKYFFMCVMPLFTERRTAHLSTPSSRAIWR